MKNISTLAALILVILTHSACRTSKYSNRQQTRLAVKEQFDIKTRVQEANDYSRSKSLTDSNGQSYQLTIFPADTFQFSMKNGFIGKALKVVLTGSSEQIIRLNDTSKFAGLLTSELEGKVRRDSTVNMKNRSVSVERRGMIWKGIGVGLILGIIVFGVWRKLRKSLLL